MAYRRRGEEFQVNTQTQWAQIAPKMARLSNGGFVALWLDFTGDNRGQIFDSNGNRVGAEFVTKGWSVTGLAGGGFVTIWFDDNEVRAQIFDNQGAPVGPSFLANTSTDGNQNADSVAALADGGFVITWTDHRVDRDADILGQRFSATGAKVGDEFVVTDDTLAPDGQTGSVAAGLAGGGFVVAWNEGLDIRAQRYDSAGAKAGAAFTVNSKSNYVDDPRIAALAGGGFVIIWTRDHNLGGAVDLGIHGQVYGADGAPVGGEFTITSEEPFIYGPPDVAALAAGGFVVTWSSETGDGSGRSVKAQVYDDLGNRSGPEFVANTTTAADQDQSSVIGLTSGDFVIAWSDDSQTGGDTSEAAVRAQLFHVVPPCTEPYQHSGAEILVNTTTAGGQLAPRTAQLADGNHVVLWLDTSGRNRGQILDSEGNRVGAEFATDGWHVAALSGGGFVAMWGDGADVFARIHDDRGVPIGPAFTANAASGNQNAASISALSSGGFVIVWEDASGAASGDIDVRAQRFDSGGAKVGSEFIVNRDAVAPGFQLDPEVAGLAGGGFVVTWESEGHIKAQLYDSAGGRLGTEYLVSSGIRFMADPQIVALGNGGFAIVWTRSTALNGPNLYEGIYARIYAADGTPAGREILVSADGPATDVSLDAGALAGGGFLVSWASKTGDGDGTAIRAQILDDDGNEVGAELIVNTTSRANQIQPSVLGLRNGDFLAAWADGSGLGGDVDPFAIRSQLFHAVAPIEGSYRDETLRGTALNDVILGWSGDDDLRGLAGNDVLDGGDGDDVVRGGAGDDILEASGLGSDLAEGGSGIDTLVADFSESWTSVISSWGPIANTSEGGFDGGFRDEGARWLNYTSIERFVVTGGLGCDTLVTASGDDVIDGGVGDDVMRGGLGNDVYHVDSAGDVVDERAGEGRDEVRTGLAVYVLAANVENLTATTDSAHDFRGNAGDNEILGGAGNDSFRLQDGGSDIVVGGLGNDFFYFGAALTGADRADGGAGNDQLAIQGNYALDLGASLTAIESMVLLPGSDTRFGDGAGNFYDYALTARDSNVAAGARLTVDANRLRAGEDFTFNGSAETDGDFFLIGGKGRDTLTGGARNDTFLFGENGQWGSSDTVDGGPGGSNDQLAFRGNYTILFGANQLTGIESIALVSAQDTRFGPLGSIYNYNLTMNDGNVAAGQMLTVDGGNLRSGETLTFNGAAETNGAFRVAGGAGADTIAGGSGNDILIGRTGADTLRGGAGNDIFRIDAVTESASGAADRILDFASGDRIDLSRIDAVAGTAAFTWIGAAAFTNTAGQLRAVQSGGDWTVQADVNGDGVADLEILVHTTGPAPLTAADFVL